MRAHAACGLLHLQLCLGFKHTSSCPPCPSCCLRADQVPGSAGVVARRCLSILRAVAQVMPLAQLLSPAATAALVRVLAGRYRGSASDSEIQQEAAALVLLLAR